MRIVLTGGGSGGHLFPLIAVAEKIKEKLGSDVQMLYIGSGLNMERDVMQSAGIPVKWVLSGKLRRYVSVSNVIDFFKVPIGFVQALWHLLWYMPDVVFSKGGYVAVPTVLAAWVYRIPIVMHESDAVPGIANRFLSSFASRIAVAYPSASEYFSKDKCAFVGNPIRSGLSAGDGAMLRKQFGFTESKKTILVLGGSQGAKAVNDAIVRLLPQILEFAQVIHQTGQAQYESVIHAAAQQGVKAGHEGYKPFAFIEQHTLRDALALSDMVVSRAGASSIAEIAANGKPSILIPLPGSANDHQRINAYEIAKMGGAYVLEETNFGEHIILDLIKKLLFEEETRTVMSEKVKTFYHPQAAEILANGIIEMGV